MNEQIFDTKFETLTIEQTERLLETDAENGLTAVAAQERLEKFGPNKLQEKQKKSWIRVFFEQMNNPMIFVLFAAIAVTIGISVFETIDKRRTPILIHER